MSDRPHIITAVGCLFIVAGVTGIVYHSSDLKELGAAPELIWVLAVRVLAIVGGIFALRGANWARWLIVAWMAYHTALSVLHSTLELVVHISFLALAVYAMFNSKASAYFRRKKT